MDNLQNQSLVVVKSFFAAFELKDQVAIADLFADDIVLDVPFSASGDPAPQYVLEGKKKVMENINQTCTNFERIGYVNPTYTVSADGSRVFFEAKGDMVSVKGVPYRNVYLHVFTLQDGKIKRFSQYANPVSFLNLTKTLSEDQQQE